MRVHRLCQLASAPFPTLPDPLLTPRHPPLLPMQAARDIADTLAKSRNIVYLPSGGNMLLGVNPNQ